jgi:hypothetical protein
MGGDRVIAAISLHVLESVARGLAVDGGAVAAEWVGDLLDRQLGVEQPAERASLLEGKCR